MITSKTEPTPVTVDWNPLPESSEEKARRDTQHRNYTKNRERFQALIPELYEKHLGKWVCISGGESFISDTGKEALARARAAHPEESGAAFLQFLSDRRGPKIYAI